MAEEGWIKLWRKSVNNEFYFGEPFDKWHAWMDLLMMAEYDSRSGQPGTVKTTLKALKIRWSWPSRRKVWEHLRTLEGKGMVTVKGTPSGTLITIVKWGFYQDAGNTFPNTLGNKKRTPSGTQEYIYIKKNNKEDKEDKEKRVSSNEEEIFMTGEEMRKKWNTSST